MKRLRLVLPAVAVGLAVVSSAAMAKGPIEASVTGPGLGSPLTFGGGETLGSSTMALAEAAGFFPAAFGQNPDPMLDKRPKGDLGLRYTATYDLGQGPYGGENLLVQDVYPYAKPNPVTYMTPRQTFYGGMRTRGGWFVAASPFAPSLIEVLVAAGLPRTPPSPGDGSPFPWPLVAVLGALGAALAVGAAALTLARRRPGEPATS